MMKFKTILIFLALYFVSCMTLHLKYLNMEKSITKEFSTKHFEEVNHYDIDILQLNFKNLESSYSYKNCFSTKIRYLDSCKENKNQFVNKLTAVKDEDYFIEQKKGFIFFNNKYAFIHDKMILNYYEDGKGQFGFPLSISIHADGKSRFITYPKPRPDLNEVCYYEILNEENNRFQFKSDCPNLKNQSNFYPMKKVKIPHSIYLLFANSDNNLHKKNLYIVKYLNHNFFIKIDSISGQKYSEPNPFLYFLYPFSIILDIITFPIQIFLFNFGKTALG